MKRALNNNNQDHIHGLTAAAASALLGAVDAEVRVLRDVERRLASSSAPHFTAFDFLRTDELGLSACIASLLNPAATHGQGAAYLRLFLLELECEPGSAWFNGLDRARVTLEAPANGLRRFDIEMLLDGGPSGRRAIVIENKPWAVDQRNQLSDYALQLSSTCADDGWKLVYLSAGGPSEQSMPPEEVHHHQAAGSIQLMPFEALAQWLARCAQVTRPIAVRLFIEQMEQFIRKTLCGETDMIEADSIQELVRQSPQSLRAALLVASSMNAVKTGLLLEGLKAPLEDALHQRAMHLHWENKMEALGSCAGFGAQVPAAAQGYVRFEFERANLGGLFWGIFRGKPLPRGQDEVPGAQELQQTMTARFGRGGSSAHWFWYSTDLSPLEHQGATIPRDWQVNDVPWVGMQHRTLHQPFVALVERIHRELAGTPAGALLDRNAQPGAIESHVNPDVSGLPCQ